ncbi:MAG: hypothetical protein IIA33_10065 [Planctomycetes bacterium]|nr:hypothetical protein [Planctomycetota bacterium]
MSAYSMRSVSGDRRFLRLLSLRNSPNSCHYMGCTKSPVTATPANGPVRSSGSTASRTGSLTVRNPHCTRDCCRSSTVARRNCWISIG